MKKVLVQFKISEEEKRKLIYDSVKNNFPSMTAYFKKLIETGLPVEENLDIRLQLIDKKVETNAANAEIQTKKIMSFVKDIFKRNFIVYRIVYFLLSRSFFIKPGEISEEDTANSKAYIEEQLRLYEKRYEGKE
jgi:hypothetical protein